MKDIRIWFKKDGLSRFISHLDLSRCMSRAIHRLKIPVWYTEGFNPHPFVTFALPLSLGVRGMRESMDVRMINDTFELDVILNDMNKCLPKGIEIIDVTEPEMSAGKICYAKFSVYFEPRDVEPDILINQFRDMLDKPEILVSKKTKSGVRETDIKKHISNFDICLSDEGVRFEVVLPAGSDININPNLIIDALEKYYGTTGYVDITRQNLYDKDMKEFR